MMSREDNRQAIFSYIEKNGIYNKDIDVSNKSSTSRKICRKHSVRVILDLHGMKCEDAARKVKSFVTQSRERGIREILIIHGKGNHSIGQGQPVLKKLVRDMLEAELHHTIRDYRSALPKEGGDGATLVYL
ncbi:MAG TPA: Smr/MutS family protein [Chitinispirillaceae bacterium]|nr:Smr/MutS family protein [Chitinispirillaceae bacterium]